MMLFYYHYVRVTISFDTSNKNNDTVFGENVFLPIEIWNVIDQMKRKIREKKWAWSNFAKSFHLLMLYAFSSFDSKDQQELWRKLKKYLLSKLRDLSYKTFYNCNFCHLLSLCRTQTLVHGIFWQVFCHCATPFGQFIGCN